MLFHNAYIRGTPALQVPDEEIRILADMLAARPVELLMTGLGAVQISSHATNGQVRLARGRQAAAALAVRNIRSLLSGNRSERDVAAALKTALAAPPLEAEEALEDAELELNLRYTLYATADTELMIENRALVLTDGAATTESIDRQSLRERGARFFRREAISRLVAMNIAEVRFSRTAVQPLALQIEPGALMEPDTAHQHLHKGEWRSARKPDFIKDYCVACGRCFTHCPDNAIIHARYEKSARETTGILGIDTDRCTACGLCAAVCPTHRDGYKAIVMIAAHAEGTPELHCVG